MPSRQIDSAQTCDPREQLQCFLNKRAQARPRQARIEERPMFWGSIAVNFNMTLALDLGTRPRHSTSALDRGLVGQEETECCGQDKVDRRRRNGVGGRGRDSLSGGWRQRRRRRKSLQRRMRKTAMVVLHGVNDSN